MLLRFFLVSVSRRRFPPIWPPLRPIEAIYSESPIGARGTLGVAVTGSAVVSSTSR